jgi:hypothetical protein
MYLPVLHSRPLTTMWHLIHLLAVSIEFLLGIFCVLTAIVLYPDEEGKIQSKFEDFWVRVDDSKRLALSRHAAFMTQVAKLETRFLDRVFGTKLISRRALGISVCCSLGALLFALVLFFFSYFGILLWVALLISVVYFLFALASARFLQQRTAVRKALRVFGFILLVPSLGLLILFLPMVYAFAQGSAGGNVLLFLAMFLTVIGGFACDVLFIALTRRLVRWVGEMNSSLKVLATVIVNL